jgi:hypothetical protein
MVRLAKQTNERFRQEPSMAVTLTTATADSGAATWTTSPATTIDALAIVADPGTGAAIPVTKPATISLTIAAAGETNTLAAPLYPGQLLILYTGALSNAGTRIVTCSAAINATGNNTITLNTAPSAPARGDRIILIGCPSVAAGTTLRWRVVINDGCTLSTV